MPLMCLLWSHHELPWSHPWARLPAVEAQTKYALPGVHQELLIVKSPVLDMSGQVMNRAPQSVLEHASGSTVNTGVCE